MSDKQDVCVEIQAGALPLNLESDYNSSAGTQGLELPLSISPYAECLPWYPFRGRLDFFARFV